MICEAILIPKIYARLQEIASNFLKFSGGGPPNPPPALTLSALGSGLRPLTAPLSKFLDPPLVMMTSNQQVLLRCPLDYGPYKTARSTEDPCDGSRLLFNAGKHRKVC